jgi:hypothetical protein
MQRKIVRMAKWLLISLMFALLLTEYVVSQSEITDTHTNDSDQEYGPIETAISDKKTSDTDIMIIKPRSDIEIYLSVAVLAFGLILIIFTGVVALKKNSGWDQEATRIFAVSVIVTAGLFLITAGYSDQQIAPMFGLLGTMIGYLLGKPSSRKNDELPGTQP